MSDGQKEKINMEVDVEFLKSRRGILKAAEMATLFVGFVCFSVATAPPYITATVLEFFITFFLLLLYMLKMNKRLTFFFWPLVDVFNSAFAAVYFIVLSLLACITYNVTGMLVGGIIGFLTAGLLCADGYTLFKSITFNKRRRGEAQTQEPER